jgi:nucleoside-diphosphate-sugar epimerase
MRIFVTGGSGYIGSAVIPALVKAGHEVVALSRSAEKDRLLGELGAHPHRGTLADSNSYFLEAAKCEALVHMAFDYAAQGPEQDRAAVETLLEAGAEGGARSFVFTSGVWVLGSCSTPADEKRATNQPLPMVAWRAEHEKLTLEARTDELATSVIRPGLVYGGKGGLLLSLFETAEKEGASEYVGDGKNHWPLIHREDLAELYRLVIETQAEGVFHGVDGAPLTVAEVARLASQAAGAGGKTRSVPTAEAKKKLGPLVEALALDQVVIAPRARGLGWQPRLASFAQGAMTAYSEWKA